MKLYRTWCTHCKDWTVFRTNDENPTTVSIYSCETCNTDFTRYKLSDISEDKILEQRERYKTKRRQNSSEMFNTYLNFCRTTNDMFSDVKLKDCHATEIIESDAGLVAFEKRKKELQREQYEAHQIERAKFVGLGRNEQCRCGSGKKYKKCCYDKYN